MYISNITQKNYSFTTHRTLTSCVDNYVIALLAPYRNHPSIHLTVLYINCPEHYFLSLSILVHTSLSEYIWVKGVFVVTLTKFLGQRLKL